jgi:hypothetical protein
MESLDNEDLLLLSVIRRLEEEYALCPLTLTIKCLKMYEAYNAILAELAQHPDKLSEYYRMSK